MEKDNKKISLYCVPTPIGNLSDVSPRVKEVLNEVDFIAAEDTRRSGTLLMLLGIKKPMVSYFQHNMTERGQMIIDKLLQGMTCALITDAGMPAISDPGEELVAQCYANGLKVSAIPGPSAFVTALAMSGLSTKRFTFEGFPSTNLNSRKDHLLSLSEEKRTMVFYEAPHHLLATLKTMKEAFGQDRRISLVREISKIYEEVKLITIGEAIDYYENNPPKGEFVLIVEGKEDNKTVEFDEKEVDSYFSSLIKEGCSKKDASQKTADHFGIPKKIIYNKYKNT